MLAVLLGVLSGCQKKPQASAGAPQMPPVQVVAVTAARQPVAETLSLVGSVSANEMVEIKAETDGIVEEISFQEGQKVEKGQLLVRLEEGKLAAAVAESEANFKLSSANFERSKQLFTDKLISQQEFDQAAAVFQVNHATLEKNKRLLRDTRINASFKGVVGARNISPGQVIAKNTTLTWVIDADPIKVEFNVPERFLSQLKPNQTIEITVAAYPNRTFNGKVFFVSPFVDSETRTALVKAQIPNPENELKPGMFANLDLTLTVRDNSVVIPETALLQVLADERATVYMIAADGTAQPKQIKLGVRLSGQVEVLSGLQGGEKIIIEGLQKIGPGSKVQAAPAEPAAPQQSPPKG